jgi:sec-independent protein translocase protein TatA
MITPSIIGGLGTTELLIILAVLVLLFGATKLPELARGSGRALRIFKAETKGLLDDDEDDVPASKKTAEEREIEARQVPVDEYDAERQRRGDTTT